MTRNRTILSTIETILREKTGLNQICAVAILDENLNFALPAVVVKLASDFALTETDVLEISEDCLKGDLKLTGGVFFVQQLPLMEDGKLDRVKIEEIANDFHHEQIRNKNALFSFKKGFINKKKI